MLRDRRMPAGEAEGEGVQNRGQTSGAVWGGDSGNNEGTRSKNRSEWDEDAEVDVRCNEERHVRGTTRLTAASTKVTEKRLKWYGHIVMRREEEHVVRRALEAEIPGNRRRGRPKRR